LYRSLVKELSDGIEPNAIKEPCRNIDKLLSQVDPETGDWRAGYSQTPQAAVFRVYCGPGGVAVEPLSGINYFAVKCDNEPAALMFIKVAVVIRGVDGIYRPNHDWHWVLYAFFQEPILGNNSEKVRLDLREGVVWKSTRDRAIRRIPHRLHEAGLIELSADGSLPQEYSFQIDMEYKTLTNALSAAIVDAFSLPEDDLLGENNGEGEGG